jgi:hypothetical protein
MKQALLIAVLGSLLAANTASAIVVSLPASRDNTLYENVTGAVSNGAGDYVFTGVTREGFQASGSHGISTLRA